MNIIIYHFPKDCYNPYYFSLYRFTGAKGRNKYLDVLKDISNDFKDKSFAYLWMEGAQ